MNKPERSRGDRAGGWDRYRLYELAVTAPAPLSRFLQAVHAGRPRTLREDFSGSGALSRGWVECVENARAIAVDQDPEPLSRLAGFARIEAVCSDVLSCRQKADILAATNFPIGYWQTRPALLGYLRHARACLNPRGVMVCDLYGGAGAMTPGKQAVILRTPAGERIEYTWDQKSFDPVSMIVENAMHFRVRPTGRAKSMNARPRVIRNAFTYRWRLWSIAELSEAMLEAGFRKVEVYDTLGDAIDHRGRLYVNPVDSGEQLGENWVVYVAARR